MPVAEGAMPLSVHFLTNSELEPRKIARVGENEPVNSAASMSVMADHVDRYQQEVGEFVPDFQLHQRDDIVTALVEAERALRNASRCLRRAVKLAAETS